MDIQGRCASRFARNGALLALMVFAFGCSDAGVSPFDVSPEVVSPQFSGGDGVGDLADDILLPTPPPNLSAEHLTHFGTNRPTVYYARCSEGTFSYSLSGTALGPYPGTFTEKGTVTVKNGFVTYLKAYFTIYSENGKIWGMKWLSQPGVAAGVCQSNTFAVDPADLDYKAIIITGGHWFIDQGTSMMLFEERKDLLLGTDATMLEEAFFADELPIVCIPMGGAKGLDDHNEDDFKCDPHGDDDHHDHDDDDKYDDDDDHDDDDRDGDHDDDDHHYKRR